MSFSPKVRIAQSFTWTGVRSMAAPPTAVTGPASGLTAAETSSATVRAANPASSPLRAARALRVRAVRLILTVLIRNRGAPGLLRAPVRIARDHPYGGSDTRTAPAGTGPTGAVRAGAAGPPRLTSRQASDAIASLNVADGRMTAAALAGSGWK